MSLSKEQILLEYAKCVNDTPYALRTYLQTYDNTQSQYVPLELFNDQVTLVKDYDTCEENIALKYRQAGVSTVTSAWASKRLVFAKKSKPVVSTLSGTTQLSMHGLRTARSCIYLYSLASGTTN